MNTIRNLIIVAAAALWTVHGEGQEKKIDFDVKQITWGPKHQLFGYIDQSFTIPWNQGDQYILALRTDFYLRMPKAGESAEVVMIDTWNDHEVIPLDKTFVWNLQQGTIFYRNPNKPRTCERMSLIKSRYKF